MLVPQTFLRYQSPKTPYQITLTYPSGLGRVFFSGFPPLRAGYIVGSAVKRLPLILTFLGPRSGPKFPSPSLGTSVHATFSLTLISSKSMFARRSARRLPCTWKRTFSTSLSLRKPVREKGPGAERAWSNPTRHHEQWNGRSVIALTATAGILGFGLATASLQGPPKRTVTLFDSKSPTPQYATLDEMELVSRPLLTLGAFSFF